MKLNVTNSGLHETIIVVLLISSLSPGGFGSSWKGADEEIWNIEYQISNFRNEMNKNE
jgi:hypothetical protein